MNEIIKCILSDILPIILEVVIMTLCGIATSYLKKKIRSEEVRNVIGSVVRATEQVYKDIHGQEKLHNAEKKVKCILESKGITIPDDEIITLIESTVHEMNETIIQSYDDKGGEK